MLVLGWGESALSLSAIWKILQQMCQAYRYEGGVTVVVLCEKPKLEMEALAEAQVPPGARHGSRFVFRQVRQPPNGGELSLWGWGACMPKPRFRFAVYCRFGPRNPLPPFSPREER